MSVHEQEGSEAHLPPPPRCYPYYQFWRKRAVPIPTVRDIKPETLFVYGRRKRVQFHGPSFLRNLEARTDGSSWAALECGHFICSQDPEGLASIMHNFLSVS